MNGFKGYNDIVFAGGKECPQYNVIYIGGDIQDLESNMKNHQNRSLEKTAALLHERYERQNKNVHVYVIRPSLYKNTFQAIYKNFLEMINEGHPVYKKDTKQTCANHLHRIMQASADALSTETSIKIGAFVDRPTHLVAFSKGCVVLTQLLYDLGRRGDDTMSKWFDNVRHITWLDSGHNGAAELWPVSADIMKDFSKSFPTISLHAYATPFQLKRASHPRARSEFDLFRETLQLIDCKHHCGTLLEDHNNDMMTHFRILDVFPVFID